MKNKKVLNNFTNPLVKEINEKIAKLLEEYGDEYYKLYVFENRWENDRFLQDEEVAINKRENKYLFCLVDKSIFERRMNKREG
jgi:precorrin-6B methylase 1